VKNQSAPSIKPTIAKQTSFLSIKILGPAIFSPSHREKTRLLSKRARSLKLLKSQGIPQAPKSPIKHFDSPYKQ
jgi:hypothetical protein